MVLRDKRRQQWQQRTSASDPPRSTVDTALSPVGWILTPSLRHEATDAVMQTGRIGPRRELFGRAIRSGVSGPGSAGIATCYYGAERRNTCTSVAAYFFSFSSSC